MKVISIYDLDTTTQTAPQPVSTEFGHASQASALIRRGLLEAFGKDGQEIERARLTKQLMKIIKTDAVHDWGDRTLRASDMSLLEEFDLGKRKSIYQVTYMHPKASINEHTGICRIDLPPFQPSASLRFTGNITHVRFYACAMSIDFERMQYSSQTTSSGYLSVDTNQPAVNLPAMVNIKDQETILLFFGIGFYTCVNGRYHLSLGNGGLSVQCVKTAKSAIE